MKSACLVMESSEMHEPTETSPTESHSRWFKFISLSPNAEFGGVDTGVGCLKVRLIFTSSSDSSSITSLYFASSARASTTSWTSEGFGNQEALSSSVGSLSGSGPRELR